MNDTQILTIAFASVPTMLTVLIGILLNNARLSDVNSRLGELRSHMDGRFNDVDRRFDGVDRLEAPIPGIRIAGFLSGKISLSRTPRQRLQTLLADRLGEVAQHAVTAIGEQRGQAGIGEAQRFQIASDSAMQTFGRRSIPCLVSGLGVCPQSTNSQRLYRADRLVPRHPIAASFTTKARNR